MVFDGLDEALKEAARPKGRGARQRGRQFGWRQVLAQVLYDATVAAFVADQLLYAEGDL